MQSLKQQQILDYFIEEAQEHLDTIEQGLVDLSATLADRERVNELFRAAHSVKGGAAMLGFDGIHRTAHHFEDCFKILQEPTVEINQNIEDLFLRGFDALRELIDGLQNPFGWSEEEAEKVAAAVEPTFQQLQQYLRAASGVEPVMFAEPGVTVVHRHAPVNAKAVKAGLVNAVDPHPASPNAGALANLTLKAMLQLFKQADSPSGRQQLLQLCQRLIQVSPHSQHWVAIVETAYRAIANPGNSYTALAPVVIKELKQASDLLLLNSAAECFASATLQRLSQGNIQSQMSVPVSQGSIVSIVLEPIAAAQTLIQVFSPAELLELVEHLMPVLD